MQWGGWFRKEIKRSADLKGLKMRIAGLGGHASRAWASFPSRSRRATSIRRSSVARSTRSSTSAPTTTRSSASTRSRKYYYTPGWQEGGTLFHALANTEKWNALPAVFKKAVEVAATATTTTMMAHYDTKNPEALLRLIAGGATVSLFPPEVIETIYAAAQEHYAGLIASNETFPRSTIRKRSSGTGITSTTRSPTSNTMRPCSTCGANRRRRLSLGREGALSAAMRHGSVTGGVER